MFHHSRLLSATFQQIAEAVRASQHQHLGISTHPPSPPHAPAAARLQHKDLNSLTTALDSARAYWPNTPLSLIGAHGVPGTTNIDDPTDTLPPGFAQVPQSGSFVSFPIDDTEAQDQLNAV